MAVTRRSAQLEHGERPASLPPASLHARTLVLLRRLLDREDPQAAAAVALLLCCCEAVLCAAIIWKVPYTEIDWQARSS